MFVSTIVIYRWLTCLGPELKRKTRILSGVELSGILIEVQFTMHCTTAPRQKLVFPLPSTSARDPVRDSTIFSELVMTAGST